MTTYHDVIQSGNYFSFEKMIMQGQWWDTDIEQLNLRPAPICDAYLINGLAGDSYPCSENSNIQYLRNNVKTNKKKSLAEY